jgi:hypothetical protein
MANKFTDAVFHALVPAVDKAVLYALAYRTDNATGACYPSIRTIAKEAGCSNTIVKAVITYAVSIGVLAIKARRDGNINLANEYVFSLSGLRWLERADSRYVPDGETDTGVRATLGKLPPQGGKQPTGGLVDGRRVYKRPAQGWGGSRLKNSEVDLRIGARHSNSKSNQSRKTKTEDTDQNPYPNGQPELQAMLIASPEILHDKSCPCYPRKDGVLCLCGLYEILLDDLMGVYDCACMEPRPDTNGDSLENYGASCTKCKGFVIWPKWTQELCPNGCGDRCTGSCEAVPGKGQDWAPGPEDFAPARPFEVED